MTTVPSSHVSWNKLWLVIGILFVPCFGALIMVVRGGQQLIDKMDVVIIKVDKTDSRMDRFEEKLNAVSARVDTISHRQEVNNLTQTFKYQLQQAQRAIPQWHPKPGYITQTR